MSDEITDGEITAKIIEDNSMTTAKIEKPKRQRKAPVEVDPVQLEEKVLMFMRSGAGWVTPSGLDFTPEHPYKLVPQSEVPALLSTERFRKASPDEVKRFYNGEGH